MPKGGRIMFSTAVEQEQAVVRVADNGPGVPPEIRQRVFEPFFTTKRGEEGTGLGLSVSFGIIQAHQGTIDLEPDEGRGTTFTIRLPLANDGA